jgi:hypothetical protein
MFAAGLVAAILLGAVLYGVLVYLVSIGFRAEGMRDPATTQGFRRSSRAAAGFDREASMRRP